MGRDEELFGLVSSVNLACGFHAGDPRTMLTSVRLAAEHGVAVGAHPGFPDRVGFGRREMHLGADEVYADVLYQLGALSAFLVAEGRRLHHVKPHGAMYMQMTRDEGLCRAVAAATRAFAEEVPLIVLAGSKMEGWARAEGVSTVAEAFPDRAYLGSGLLAPRSMGGSLVRQPEAAAATALAMARSEPFESIDGGWLRLEPQTLCIHGDNPESVEVAAAVRDALECAGIGIKAF